MHRQSELSLSQDSRFEVTISSEREKWLVTHRHALGLTPQHIVGELAKGAGEQTKDSIDKVAFMLPDGVTKQLSLKKPIRQPQQNECILVKPNLYCREDGSSDDLYVIPTPVGYYTFNEEQSLLELNSFARRLVQRIMAKHLQLTRSNMQLGFDDAFLQRHLNQALEKYDNTQVADAYHALCTSLATHCESWLKNGHISLFNSALMLILDLKHPEDSYVSMRHFDHPIVTGSKELSETPRTLMNEINYSRINPKGSWEKYTNQCRENFCHGLENLVEYSNIGFGFQLLRQV